MSTASSSGQANGEIPSNGEAAVLAVADSFESSEVAMGIGCGEAVATAVEQGLGELGFGAEGVDGGIEVPDLVLVLPITRDVGGETPVPQLFDGFS